MTSPAASPSAGPPAGDPAAPDPEGQRIQSLDSLAARQDTIEGKVDELLAKIGGLLPGGQPKPADGGAPPGGATPPGSVEEQVRAELERRDRKAAADKAKADADAEAQQLREDVAKLKETRPQAPVRRATRLLGWGDGRR